VTGALSIANAWSRGWVAPDRRPIYVWAAENVILPAGVYTETGPFDVQKSRYMIDAFDALQSDIVRVVTLRWPVRSGKSLIPDVFLEWVIKNDPGPFMFNLSTDKLARRHISTRIRPNLERCEVIQDLLPERMDGTDLVMRNGMPVYVQGPSIGNLTGVPVRYLVDDELWEREEGKHGEAVGRLGDYERLGNSKLLNLSQGGNEGDEVELEFDAGDQCEWSVPCLKCNDYQPAAFMGYRENESIWGIRFDEIRRENGDWDIPKVLPTVRFECRACGFPHLDNQRTRIEWNRLGKYLAQNARAPKSHRSFHLEAVVTRPWDLLVEEWLKAMNAKRRGNLDPLVKFTQKRRALANRPSLGMTQRAPAIEIFDVKKDGAPEGWMRFLTVDCQRDLVKLYVVVRDWNRETADSRRVWRGVLETFDQVRDLQIELGVADQRVGVDVGYEATRVYQQQVKHGHYHVIKGERLWLCWIGLKGSASWDFAHHDDKAAARAAKALEKAPRRIYSSMQNGDPGAGRYKAKHMAPFMLWSTDQASNILGRLMSPDHKGAKWTAPPIDRNDPREVELEREYVAHLNSHKKLALRLAGRLIEKWVPLNYNPNKPMNQQAGLPDHFRDCELEQVVMAAGVGILDGS
jgi:hypothetical protein